MENSRRKQLDWVQAILDFKGWRPKRLADHAGVDHSTISKFLNDPLNKAQLNSTSVEKIARVGGIPPFHNAPVQQPRGFAEIEAEPYIPDPHDGLVDRAVTNAIAGSNQVDAWILRSRALENAGYLPGDVLLVDHDMPARDGDAVFAQIHDRAGRLASVFRIYEFPYLVATSHDAALRRPLLVDNDRARVTGVVVASLRPRVSGH